MPRYWCDYCEAYLTHDSPSVRKQHNYGFKHKANVRNYYSQFESAKRIHEQTHAFAPGAAMHAPGGRAAPAPAAAAARGRGALGMQAAPPPPPAMARGRAVQPTGVPPPPPAATAAGRQVPQQQQQQQQPPPPPPQSAQQ